MKIRYCFVFLLVFGWVSHIYAQDFNFTVNRIAFEGLHNIPESTVRTYLTLKTGDKINSKKTADVIRALYGTGFFSDIRVQHQLDNVIIFVVERPVIGDIHITGNESIPKENFKKVVRSAGLVRGRVFNQSILEQFRKALLNEYRLLSFYNATVKTQVIPMPRHRIKLNIQIHEGHLSKVASIQFVGNKRFSSRELRKQMQLSTHSLWSFFTQSDRYSEEKLDADLQSLSHFYLTYGYLDFQIKSYRVNFSQNQRKAYIVIDLYEGDPYTINHLDIVGAKQYQSDLRKLITLKVGQVFSRKALLNIQAKMSRYLADKGYAFSEIRVIPHLYKKYNRVDIRFEVILGHPVYVRHINFYGNTKTDDYVLRREMQQFEGSIFSLSRVMESKRRLANLGYLENIHMNTKSVPGADDQVDLEYHMKETSSASINFQVGYSDTDGLLYGTYLNQRNFMGTGKAVSVAFDRSDYVRTFSFSYNNPYYTMSGISRGFSFFDQRTTPSRTNISAYRTNTYGGLLHYGIPISNYSSLLLALGYERINLYASPDSSLEVLNFINQHGSNFNQFKVIGGWYFNNYDQAIFPTKGYKNQLSLEVGLPLGNRSLDYFKAFYEAALYQPLVKSLIFRAYLDLGYGRGYSRTGSDLPFFKNFYAGGIDSVRGYEGNTLGPLDSQGNAIGGNVLTTGNLGLILPPYFGPKVRTTLFLDAGNVAKNQWPSLRYSVGLFIRWRTPLAPLEFSFAKALNPSGTDRKRFFQFSFGTSF